MIIPDINLLLYAHVDAFAQHAEARVWWEELVGSRRDIGLASATLFGFLRIVTNPRVFEEPASVEAAVAWTEEWLARPNVRFLLPGPRHLEIAFGRSACCVSSALAPI